MKNNKNNPSVPATPNKIIPAKRSEKNKNWLRQNNKKPNKNKNKNKNKQIFFFVVSPIKTYSNAEDDKA